jgi:hypothetical protein
MSRRAIVGLAVVLGGLLLGNIIALSVWLPHLKNSAAKSQSSGLTTVAAPAASAAPGTNHSAPVAASAHGAEASSDFALERQITSSSGNLAVTYRRDRKSKLRRITVEDVHRPGLSAVLCESKRAAWALVSPDDQWIAVDERNATDGGGARLYHRSGNSSVQYVVAEGADSKDRALQGTVWQSYLSATHADPNKPRRGVTIDATGWESDSRKIDVCVAYLPSASNPDVPEPWRCTYDVASKQVQPAPNQPVVGPDTLNASANSQDGNQSDAAQEQDFGQDRAASDLVADNAPSSEDETGENNEYPGERFPATRLDELTVADVNESSLNDVIYAINEMFARHGAEFKDKNVTKEFAQFSWYKPRPGVSFNDIETEFSDLEKQNLKVLDRCRDAKLAANRRKSRTVRGEKEESTGEKIIRGLRTWQDAGGPLPPH